MPNIEAPAFNESENVNTVIQRYQLRMRRWMESLSRQMLDNVIRELWKGLSLLCSDWKYL